MQNASAGLKVSLSCAALTLEGSVFPRRKEGDHASAGLGADGQG